MSEAEVIAENEVKSPVTGDVTKFKTLWESQPCVIIFFRRFGCGFCRVAAKQISTIKPQLDANNVRLVGIGVEELGADEFIKGKFFDGDLFVDINKKSYEDLKFKRFGFINLMTNLVGKTSRDAISEVRTKGLGGDMKGDKYQVGGVLVVNQGGDKVLLCHKQQELADHLEPKEVLKALNIESATE